MNIIIVSLSRPSHSSCLHVGRGEDVQQMAHETFFIATLMGYSLGTDKMLIYELDRQRIRSSTE